jgi:hypothetical protein
MKTDEKDPLKVIFEGIKFLNEVITTQYLNDLTFEQESAPRLVSRQTL